MTGSMYSIGFLCNWVTTLLLCSLVAMTRASTQTFFRRWLVATLPGAIIVYAVWLTQWNWMGVPWSYLSGMVIDTLLSFALCGAWLAWWYGRK
jgi:hypothetical protein